MTNNSESDTSTKPLSTDEARGGFLKLGVVAAASALLGGIAVAWWYRKTVQKLHETGENSNNPQFGIASAHPSEDSPDET